MKTPSWIYFIAIASFIALGACDSDDDEPSINETDKAFVENAALANIAEIDLGQLALNKATDQAVKDFAEQMVTDHTMAQDELFEIEEGFKNIDWPDEMDEQHKQIRDQLINMEGYKFDSMYMATQLVDHESTRALFQKELADGTEDIVKAYAAKHLPHIEEHLQQASTILSALTNGSGD